MRRLVCALLLAFAALGAASPAPARADDQGATRVERPGRRAGGPSWRERWRSLPPEDKQRLRDRVVRLRSLPPAKRQQLRERFVELHRLAPEQRARLQANRERWRSLSPVQRERLRGAWKRLRELSPDQRQRVLERALAEQPAPE